MRISITGLKLTERERVVFENMPIQSEPVGPSRDVVTSIQEGAKRASVPDIFKQGWGYQVKNFNKPNMDGMSFFISAKVMEGINLSLENKMGKQDRTFLGSEVQFPKPIDGVVPQWMTFLSDIKKDDTIQFLTNRRNDKEAVFRIIKRRLSGETRIIQYETHDENNHGGVPEVLMLVSEGDNNRRVFFDLTDQGPSNIEDIREDKNGEILRYKYDDPEFGLKPVGIELDEKKEFDLPDHTIFELVNKQNQTAIAK